MLFNPIIAVNPYPFLLKSSDQATTPRAPPAHPRSAPPVAMEQQPQSAPPAAMEQQPRQSGANGLAYAPVFAAVVETKRRSTAERSESVNKVACLRELQLRFSPVRSALSLQNSPLDSRVEGVQGSSPLVASVSTSSVLPLPPPLPSHMSSIDEPLILFSLFKC